MMCLLALAGASPRPPNRSELLRAGAVSVGSCFVLSCSACSSQRGHMTKLRSAFAALIVLSLSPIPALPQAAVPRSFSAGFYLAGCKDFLAGKSNFFGGRCVGVIEVLDALSSDTKRFCAPENATNLQRVQVVVDYIEAQPDRKNADFRLVANEAMAKAWPCKN